MDFFGFVEQYLSMSVKSVVDTFNRRFIYHTKYFSIHVFFIEIVVSTYNND